MHTYCSMDLDLPRQPAHQLVNGTSPPLHKHAGCSFLSAGSCIIFNVPFFSLYQRVLLRQSSSSRLTMRLLKRDPDGRLGLHDFTGKTVPAYAILSHTWLPDSREEVSFQDLEAAKGECKAGWKKIQFCSERAAADGLQYFWIDTCCIDKRNAVELAEAINSMFRWYQQAARCYVYLSDVSIRAQGRRSDALCELAIGESRWFTRSWTLQELLAPKLVDFFDVDGEELGSKPSLLPIIHGVTRIPKNALQGDALSDFSIRERESWTENRDATIKEDQVYSLLGIFEVSMPLIYGEGRDSASRRLKEEIHRSYKGVCLRPNPYFVQ